jgi:hypothetical protein
VFGSAATWDVGWTGSRQLNDGFPGSLLAERRDEKEKSKKSKGLTSKVEKSKDLTSENYGPDLSRVKILDGVFSFI